LEDPGVHGRMILKGVFRKLVDEMGGTCSTYGGEVRFIQVFLVGKPEGKRPFG